MLLSFSVENFRSFKGEQTLSMMASKRLGPVTDSTHCCPVLGTGEHALRVGSLYGANGAGKSNLVRAIALLRRMVLSGTSPGEALPYSPFLLDPDTAKAPTSFDLQFVQDGDVFRYGLVFDSNRVFEEWLDVYEGTKERSLFARAEKQGGGAVVELGPAALAGNAPRKLKALAEVGARPNQLFLTEVADLDDRESQGPRFARAVDWFRSFLSIAQAGEPLELVGQMVADDEHFADFARRYLKQADTGIAGVHSQTEVMPHHKLLSLVADKPFLSARDLATEGVELLPGPAGKGYTVRRVFTAHDQGRGAPVVFPLSEESDGSKRLLSLLPDLYRLIRQGGVFVIDELERSLHPMLARKFIEFSLKAATNKQSQLIFTTHESTLLDQDLMRRDGIWFAEKDSEGATQLYSLADFKVRNDLRIEKGYLQGRFDAIPFLGGIDSLIEEFAAAEARE